MLFFSAERRHSVEEMSARNDNKTEKFLLTRQIANYSFRARDRGPEHFPKGAEIKEETSDGRFATSLFSADAFCELPEG